jgi:hypothetical protein
MSQYAVIPKDAQVLIPDCIATPENWQLINLGQEWGGYEKSQFAQAEVDAIISLGGEIFDSADEFQAWLSGDFQMQAELKEDISAYYKEAPGTRFVRVIGNFTKYYKNEILLATEVLFTDGRESRIVNLLANDLVRLPDGLGGTVGEYSYLLQRINSGENPNQVIREILHFRASNDGGYRFE